MRTFRRLAIPLLAASMASVICFAPSGAFAVSSSDTSLTAQENAAQDHSTTHMRILQLQNERFLKEHTDASGKLRPDLWRKGVEHQQHMKVAPYIGAKPLGSAAHSTNN